MILHYIASFSLCTASTDLRTASSVRCKRRFNTQSVGIEYTPLAECAVKCTPDP